MAANMPAISPRSSAFAALTLNGKVDSQTMLLVGVTIFCIFAPLELGQFTFALAGAVVYAAVQAMRKSTKAKFRGKAGAQHGKGKTVDAKQRAFNAKMPSTPQRTSNVQKKPAPRQEFRQPSAQPVTAPSFHSSTFDVQVPELVQMISPSAQSDDIMRALAAAAKNALQDLLPEAEVTAFASGDVMRGTAFGVAVPEVDIILNAEPDAIAERLQKRAARPISRAAQLDARKLQKSALRACTDELVASGLFKFRRSSFKGTEPKVTLLASGFSDKAIPVDFSVNTVAPLYNTALLTECGLIDPRARDLILIVRRWAKDRGISHAAKGHLPPYAWTLLAIYFMQVRSSQDGPTLTKLQAFAAPGSKAQSKQPPSPAAQDGKSAGEQPVESATPAALLKEFFHFYACLFDWRNEAISVRSAKRAPPNHKLPLNVLVGKDGVAHVAPSIEDPFEPLKNLGGLMEIASLARLREEFERADELCSKDASLSTLLIPWVPPEPCTLPGEVAEEVDGTEYPDAQES